MEPSCRTPCLTVGRWWSNLPRAGRNWECTLPDGGNFVGVGLYTIPEVTKLLGVVPARIRQ